MDKDDLIRSLEKISDLAKKCIDTLENEVTTAPSHKKVGAQTKGIKTQRPDFKKPARAFVKKYAIGMGGPAKFVLILSYLVKGDQSKEIASKEVEKAWGKMKTLLGMAFHPSYPMRAKEQDWVDTRKQGQYFLRPDWQDIFKASNG